MGDLFGIIVACAILALIYGAFLIARVLSAPSGTAEMVAISRAVQEGARAYLNRQYRTIAIVGIVVFAILVWQLTWLVGLGYLIGSVLSAVAGYIGMNVSVRANVRVAEAARHGLVGALRLAFRSGAITGMLVVGLALLGLAIYYFALRWAGVGLREITEALIALSFGASLISIFARLGGGIFTKGADVGADLVGKVEAGIPEDDPRNPAVIADNVGDNVGDCAGMAADLFETYLVTLVGTMLLGAIFFDGAVQQALMVFPMVIGAGCIIASIIGSFFVRLGKRNNIMGALYKGFWVAGILSIVAFAVIIGVWFGFDTEFIGHAVLFTGKNLFTCTVTGIVVTGLLIWITEYYTATRYKPVRSIAEASTTGSATNIIRGLAISMQSTALPVLVISAGILVSYLNCGLFGIAVAATSMLALAGMIVALDAYGPVTDNAGGIAEMAALPKEVRHVTDALDAVGNTTKAVTKGYAIGSAGLGALVLFTAFVEDIEHYFPNLNAQFFLEDPYVAQPQLLWSRSVVSSRRLPALWKVGPSRTIIRPWTCSLKQGFGR
jgi:K(+)-stimulated pyrophosphate-energized sodium pump